MSAAWGLVEESTNTRADRALVYVWSVLSAAATALLLTMRFTR